jgi:hypothetical protein
MKRNVTIALLALALTGLTLRAGAESTELAVNPTGTWKLITGTNAASPQTLKLKMEGEKVTGTLSRQAGDKVEQLPLENGMLKGSEIIFGTHSYAVSYINHVRQPTDTNKVSISKYQGTISGDTIKGKVERHSFMGGDRTLDWEAKRVR